MRALALVLSSVLFGCGGAMGPAPAGRATAGDPEASRIAPAASAEAGRPSGLSLRGGRDVAHDVLLALVDAIVLSDASRLSRLFAERVGQLTHGTGTELGLSRTGTERGALVRQALLAARAARLTGRETPSLLIAPGSIEIRMLSELGVPLPPDAEPTDLLVRFRTTALGRRALGSVAPGGEGALLVRPGATPLIVAR